MIKARCLLEKCGVHKVSHFIFWLVALSFKSKATKPAPCYWENSPLYGENSSSWYIVLIIFAINVICMDTKDTISYEVALTILVIYFIWCKVTFWMFFLFNTVIGINVAFLLQKVEPWQEIKKLLLIRNIARLVE